jgi:hypothetical protein
MHHSDTNSAQQDLVGSGSSTLAQAIAGQTYHHSVVMVHGDDMAMMEEHLALLTLFPDASDADVAVAVKGGSWFDTATWANGKIPTTGQDVYIPESVSVVYDGVSDARLDRVAVDGGLHFAIDVDTRLVVDTLMTNSSSILTIGTEENPVQAGVSAEIIIHRDNGAIDQADDPLELSKGIVTHGQVRIAGQDKTDHLKASIDPQAGDDFLLFDEAVTGWQTGDKLVVAGTKLVGENEFQDEIVTIKSIVTLGNGSVKVTLNEKLQHNHDTPDSNADVDFGVPVANYTRNVFIGTETDSDQYLNDGKTVPVDERGHVMFMHNDDVSVQNAEFFELGRTDKSELLDGDSNVAGRYALHFHRTGVDAMDEPALAEGNAVWGSPGWGIVHHDSNLDVISNAVFGVNGGAIIAEAGNETGVWADNITIQTTGEYQTLNSEHGNATDHPAARAQDANDIFTQGIGFGLKSRLIETTDNIAVSSNTAGYSFWPMGTESGSHIDPSAASFESIYGYDPLFGQDEVRASEIPTRVFTGNETIVSHVGFNTSADKKASETDVSTVIEDFTAWEVTQGFIGFYQNDYLVKDSVFVGLEGGITADHQKSAAGSITTGIMSREFHELKLVNNYFENFDVGIYEKNHDTSSANIHVILGNTFVDVAKEQALDVDDVASSDQYLVNDNSADWREKINLGFLEAGIDTDKSDLVLNKWYDHFSVVVDKTDSLGVQELSFGSEKGRYGGADQKTWWAENAVNTGYYLENGKYFVVVDIAVSDRVTSSVGVIPVSIELAFVESQADLPAGATNLGALPSGLGEFDITDLRLLETSGNQLDAPDPVDHDPVDPDPVDHDPVDPDPVDYGPIDPDPVDHDPIHHDPIDHDPVDHDPIDHDPIVPDPVSDGYTLLKIDNPLKADGSKSSIFATGHDASLEVDNANIEFTFNADTIDGTFGLFTKDAKGFDGGGNHISTFIKDGTLKIVFEDGASRKMIEVYDIEANRDYDLEFAFAKDGVAAYIDDQLVGSDDEFIMSWEDNVEDLQIGAFGRNSQSGSSDFKAVFEGTISNVLITTGEDFLFA